MKKLILLAIISVSLFACKKDSVTPADDYSVLKVFLSGNDSDHFSFNIYGCDDTLQFDQSSAAGKTLSGNKFDITLPQHFQNAIKLQMYKSRRYYVIGYRDQNDIRVFMFIPTSEGKVVEIPAKDF